MDFKETNPKDSIGIRKVPFSTIPSQPMAEMGLGMLEGGIKYGRHNYRVAGVRASVYYDAAMRHLTAFWEGQDVDPGSGLHHLSKVGSCMLVLRDAMLQNKFYDDRPPKAVNQNWVEEYNKLAGEIIDRYPNPKPAFTHLDLVADLVEQDPHTVPDEEIRAQQEAADKLYYETNGPLVNYNREQEAKALARDVQVVPDNMLAPNMLCFVEWGEPPIFAECQPGLDPIPLIKLGLKCNPRFTDVAVSYEIWQRMNPRDTTAYIEMTRPYFNLSYERNEQGV